MCNGSGWVPHSSSLLSYRETSAGFRPVYRATKWASPPWVTRTNLVSSIKLVSRSVRCSAGLWGSGEGQGKGKSGEKWCSAQKGTPKEGVCMYLILWRDWQHWCLLRLLDSGSTYLYNPHRPAFRPCTMEVYILAGQSNMAGRGSRRSLPPRYQATDNEGSSLYHLQSTCSLPNRVTLRRHVM